MTFPTLTPPTIPVGVPVPYPNISRRRRSQDAILFFDEADALFGKRTNVGI